MVMGEVKSARGGRGQRGKGEKEKSNERVYVASCVTSWDKRNRD